MLAACIALLIHVVTCSMSMGDNYLVGVVALDHIRHEKCILMWESELGFFKTGMLIIEVEKRHHRLW